ncbi:hypothetical protein IE077_004022 [Cardiosporidium cionae]|uniref:Uncharacterized protein n=1 Tax=Cardiosporidium cionae TaxID=476202 RepID=A0ABQ7J740_9APIC|nr:hypothetical protein IE077_004022 [Cardiosporidium cionae]|eukprot:KAF8819768.1 hypothetical protein IE077_004022 [Cardiosporidium cionae]
MEEFDDRSESASSDEHIDSPFTKRLKLRHDATLSAQTARLSDDLEVSEPLLFETKGEGDASSRSPSKERGSSFSEEPSGQLEPLSHTSPLDTTTTVPIEEEKKDKQSFEKLDAESLLSDEEAESVGSGDSSESALDTEEEEELEGSVISDGFIVDEAEVSNKESSDEDDDDEEEADVEEKLDADDLALIEENTGFRVATPDFYQIEEEKPHRRLKKLGEIPREMLPEHPPLDLEKSHITEEFTPYSDALQTIYQCFKDIPTVVQILRNER